MAKNTFAEAAARDEFSVRQERAVIVGVILDGKPDKPLPIQNPHAAVSHYGPGASDDPLAELAELVRSAGGVVVGRAVQRRQRVDPATYIGKGKAEEIRQKVDAYDADVVI